MGPKDKKQKTSTSTSSSSTKTYKVVTCPNTPLLPDDLDNGEDSEIEECNNNKKETRKHFFLDKDQTLLNPMLKGDLLDDILAEHPYREYMDLICYENIEEKETYENAYVLKATFGGSSRTITSQCMVRMTVEELKLDITLAVHTVILRETTHLKLKMNNLKRAEEGIKNSLGYVTAQIDKQVKDNENIESTLPKLEAEYADLGKRIKEMKEKNINNNKDITNFKKFKDEYELCLNNTHHDILAFEIQIKSLPKVPDLSDASDASGW